MTDLQPRVGSLIVVQIDKSVLHTLTVRAYAMLAVIKNEAATAILNIIAQHLADDPAH